MKIITVAFNNKEILSLALHNIFKNINMAKHELIVCDNSVQPNASEMLRELGRRGYLTYIRGINDAKERGSVNHRNGLLRCLEQCKDTDKVLMLDCDAFPLNDPMPMMNKLKGSSKLIGAVHPRGYVHPSIVAGYAGNIREILLREAKSIADTGKHIDTFESVVPDENFIEMKEQWLDENVRELCASNNMVRALCSYRLGASEFAHMWYFTRTNGFRTSCDGISIEVLGHIRNVYRQRMLNDIAVIVPSYGLDEKNIVALETTVKSLLQQNTSYSYSVWVALYGEADVRKSIERNDFNGCNVHHVCDLERWSRSEAFNRAMICLPYAGKYVLHDRDILVPETFIQSVGDCPYSYFINYRTVNNGGKIEPNSVGGSNTVTWEYMLTSGGMCSRMKGWGGEDREFDYRVSMYKDGFRTGRRLNLSLMHIPHAEDSDRPKDNQDIKNEVMRQGKDGLKRYNYIYDDYRRYWATL